MTVVIAVLIVLGTALELAALELARRDLDDVDEATKKRKEGLSAQMAASKWTVDDWIGQVTRTRTKGIYLFAAGLVVQAIAALLALS